MTKQTSAPHPASSLADALDREIPPDRLARALSDALTATCTTRGGTVEPDHKTRLAAAQLALLHGFGKPPERRLPPPSTAEHEKMSLKDLLRRSPAILEQTRRDLEEIEAEQSLSCH